MGCGGWSEGTNCGWLRHGWVHGLKWEGGVSVACGGRLRASIPDKMDVLDPLLVQQPQRRKVEIHELPHDSALDGWPPFCTLSDSDSDVLALVKLVWV